MNFLTGLHNHLDRIERKLDRGAALEKRQMAAIDDSITDLTSKVEANTTVIGSAKVLISGFAAQLAAAIAAAQAAGATAAQLASLSALGTTLENSNQELAAAISANTAAA